MIVSMYQAKRSVANGALYDGTLIQQWSDLYSEGITTFGETRGFEVVTVAEPAAYEAIAAVCGEWMDYEDAVAFQADVTSAFDGLLGGQVQFGQPGDVGDIDTCVRFHGGSCYAWVSK